MLDPNQKLSKKVADLSETGTPRDERGFAGMSRKKANLVLWILQGLLALLFLFAGGAKLMMPIAEMTRQTSLPGPFLRFIGVAEILGAMGLILPALLGIRPLLTPLAAAGLVIIMIGATVLSLPMGPMAFLPLVTGILVAFVAYGRWRTTSRSLSS